MTILQPELPPESVTYDFATEKLTPTKLDDAQAEAALGWALWGSLAYNKMLYRSENTQAKPTITDLATPAVSR